MYKRFIWICFRNWFWFGRRIYTHIGPASSDFFPAATATDSTASAIYFFSRHATRGIRCSSASEEAERGRWEVCYFVFTEHSICFIKWSWCTCIDTYRTGTKERKEMFYLTTHSTHFIYGYMVSDIWLRTILIVRKETRCCHIGYSFRLTARVLLYAYPTDRIANTTAFVTPVVEHWLEREIAQWVHPMKDWSDDPSHHERTLLPRSYISLPLQNYAIAALLIFWLTLHPRW